MRGMPCKQARPWTRRWRSSTRSRPPKSSRRLGLAQEKSYASAYPGARGRSVVVSVAGEVVLVALLANAAVAAGALALVVGELAGGACVGAAAAIAAAAAWGRGRAELARGRHELARRK